MRVTALHSLKSRSLSRCHYILSLAWSLFRPLFLVTLFFAVVALRESRPLSTAHANVRKTRASESYGKLPLYFVENAGQMDKEVAYYIQGRDKSIYFTPSGVTFALISRIKADSTAKRWIVKLDFVGARSGVRPEGEVQTEAVFSYFKGSSDEWKPGLRSFEKIVYRELWPGSI